MPRTPAPVSDTANPDVAAIHSGDEAGFNALARRYRRELHVHCYRMLASFEDAEDVVQDTFLRAWQKRETYQGRAPFRAWLYRIATNACLDFLDRHERRVKEVPIQGTPPAEGARATHVAWLQPYPDRLLEHAAPDEQEPDRLVLRRESIELAFLVAMQTLPPKQRAVLILREVLDWSAKEAADLLETSVASVNSLLQRAKAAMRRHRPSSARDTSRRTPDESEQRLLRLYVEAAERCDIAALTALLREDVFFTMLPDEVAFQGAESVTESWVEGGLGQPPYDDFRCLVVYANGMPAVANYVRIPGESAHRLFALDVLRIEEGKVAEIIGFPLAGLAQAFGLPETLS